MGVEVNNVNSNPGGAPYGYGGAHPAAPAPAGGARPGAQGHDAVDTKVDDFWKYAQSTSDSLKNLNSNDPTIKGNADRYYGEADAPIQSDFFKQADSVSSYLARQGMGTSQGVNVAASNQLNNNKAALEGQARMKATDLALEKGRQGILDAFSTRAMGLQPELQDKGINVSSTIAQMQLQAQLQMFQEQMDAQESAGIGQMVGSLGGMGMGAAILAASDERLKRSIIRYEQEAHPGVPFASWQWADARDEERHYGVIAQDVRAVRPDLVAVREDGYLAVDYGRLFGAR